MYEIPSVSRMWEICSSGLRGEGLTKQSLLYSTVFLSASHLALAFGISEISPRTASDSPINRRLRARLDNKACALIAAHKRICNCEKMSILQIDEFLIKLRGTLVSGRNSD